MLDENMSSYFAVLVPVYESDTSRFLQSEFALSVIC